MKDKNRQDYVDRLLDFVLATDSASLGENIFIQAQKCFLDLVGVLCAGAKNNSSKRAAAYVNENFGEGEYYIFSTGVKSSLIGATLANGMAANALDMDDGYSLLRGHPGAGFFGALLTAAQGSGCTYGEFLTALIVCYEVSIRQGFAIRDYYKWDHSSGCYSAFASAAGVGRLMGLSRHEMEMALGICDFIAPLNPAKRSCSIPSMNKDGIYFGFDKDYWQYLDTFGEKYYMFDLYVKFYSCCRWAHSPIRAVKSLMEEYSLTADQIGIVDIYSFGNAGTLYKCAPKNEDEAQYNIKYPIAAQIIFGDCGPLESSTTKMLDDRIAPMLERIHFHHETKYDEVFPGRRLSRAEITLKDGRKFISEALEPEGDRNSDVTMEDIVTKIRRINEIYSEPEYVDNLIDVVLNTQMDEPFEGILDKVAVLAGRNIHPEIKFI